MTVAGSTMAKFVALAHARLAEAVAD